MLCGVGIWLALFVVMIFLVVFVDDPGTGIQLTLGALTLGGVILVISGLTRFGRLRAMPRVKLSKDAVEVGESVTVQYAPGQAGREQGVIGRLICSERVRFRPRGQRKQATDQHDWVVREASGVGARGELSLTVPPDAMHSYRSRHHEIAWAVEVEPKRGGKSKRVRVPLTVVAAVADS
jgi:hypothetical protein